MRKVICINPAYSTEAITEDAAATAEVLNKARVAPWQGNADMLSPAYVRNNEQTGALLDDIVHFAHLQPTLEDCLQEIRSETQQDRALQELINIILTLMA